MHDISLVTLNLTTNNTRNLSFSFIIRQSIINQNTVVFKEERESDKLTIMYFSWFASKTNN